MQILNPKPANPKPETRNPGVRPDTQTPNPQPYPSETRIPDPSTSESNPQTLNPTPLTANPGHRRASGRLGVHLSEQARSGHRG